MTLSRTGYYCVIALVGFVALPTEASSQQRPLRDQLVGVCIPAAHETTFEGDGKHHQFGANPTGMMILDARNMSPGRKWRLLRGGGSCPRCWRDTPSASTRIAARRTAPSDHSRGPR
jgi:hypothetical protein